MSKIPDPLLSEIETLRSRLSEALEALEAIRTGGVDALVVYGEEGEKVYTLEGADQPYRTMVEAINEGAAMLSADGLVLWGNACLAGTLNAPLEMLLGSAVSQWIAPEDRLTFEAVLEKSFAGQVKTELELQALGGQHVPVLLSMSRVLASESGAICLVATDLSEHKRNIEIAAAERMAKAIIEQAAESIVVCDKDGLITRASQRAYHLAGQNPLLKSFDEVFPLSFDGAPAGGNPFSLKATLEGQVFQGVEASLRRAPTNGAREDVFNLQISATPLILPGEANLGCVITMTDVTERKRSEQAIREYAERLERSNKDLEDFAFIASHDLKEPLRKIRSFGAILNESYRELLDEEGSNFVDRMQDAANRMDKMINDLLSYSRVTMQSQPFERVDLNQVLSSVISDLESRLQATAGQVDIQELPVIEADPVQMRQLLQNLVGNALKFHKPNTQPRVKVYSVSTQELGSGKRTGPAFITIYVEDNGIGFDTRYLDRIFQPFQRLHGRSEFEGSGIGLSVCRRIIERHHGSITAESAPGEGARFIISLPIRQPVF